MKSALARKLDEFEMLDLEPEDQGFLRLAKLVLEPAHAVISRPGAEWDSNGLVS